MLSAKYEPVLLFPCAFATCPGTRRDQTRTRRLFVALVSLRGVRHKLARYVARETRRPRREPQVDKRRRSWWLGSLALGKADKHNDIKNKRMEQNCGFPRPRDAYPVGVARRHVVLRRRFFGCSITALAPSSGEEPAPRRYRAGVALGHGSRKSAICTSALPSSAKSPSKRLLRK